MPSIALKRIGFGVGFVTAWAMAAGLSIVNAIMETAGPECVLVLENNKNVLHPAIETAFGFSIGGAGIVAGACLVAFFVSFIPSP